MPRLFRESPLNGIWEGSGNVAALDLMRVLAREPEAVDAFFTEVAEARGADSRLDDAADRLRKTLASAGQAEARRLAEEMTLVLQGSLLVRHAPAAVADAFCASRLCGDWGRAFGTLPSGLDLDAVIDRGRLAGPA
jgi:putative acyl-CoA dehydrogenase